MSDVEDIAAVLSASTGQPIGILGKGDGLVHITVGGVIIDSDDPPSFDEWREARGFGPPCSLFPMGCEHPDQCHQMGAVCEPSSSPAAPEETWKAVDFDELKQGIERNRRRRELRRSHSRIVRLACVQVDSLPEPLARAVREFMELRGS